MSKICPYAAELAASNKSLESRCKHLEKVISDAKKVIIDKNAA